jgi:AcrR family transcriptional regulator
MDQIAARGLEGLRLRDVAAAVGLDHSTIHHYFSTKEDLLAAVADLATRPFWGTTPEAGTPQYRLPRHLDNLAKMIVGRPDLYVVLRELDLRAARDPAIAGIVRSREHGWRGSLLDVFKAGSTVNAWAEGVVPAKAVEMVIATVKGASLRPESAVNALAQLARILIRPGATG